VLPAPIRKLSEKQAIDQIIRSVKRAPAGDAPFALVLGAGFSFGLVPTAKDLVMQHLPMWWRASGDAEKYRRVLADATPDSTLVLAREFWKEFAATNQDRGLDLKFNNQGLPENIAEAYQAAFSPDYDDAVGAPADARKFQRALMQLERYRLNAAHFLLASLLGVQPGRSRSSELFNATAAFSRLILTTNFDPFLQIALQAVSRLYFMSDTPDLGVSDEIFDDNTDAIHLIYLPGVHRLVQAATEAEIRAIKEKNARILAPVLKRRGVIVLGYSGWDDAIVEALNTCTDFDHRLYWCGRAADPLSSGTFGPHVKDILSKRSANYVVTSSAGNFMLRLHNGLVRRLPRLLDNPVGQVRQLLESIDLSELSDLSVVGQHDQQDPTAALSASERDANVDPVLMADLAESAAPTKEPSAAGSRSMSLLESARLHVISRLKTAESQFQVSIEASTSGLPQRHSVGEQAGPGLGRYLESAELAFGLNNYAEVQALCREALSSSESTTPTQRAALLLLHGKAADMLGDAEQALRLFGEVSVMQEVPLAMRSWALLRAGVLQAKAGNFAGAVSHYAQIIETKPEAAADVVAAALLNRGLTFARMGEMERELSDYTQIIEQLNAAPAESIAAALLYRGRALARGARFEEAVADYTRLIGNPNAPIEYVGRAIVNRGFAVVEKGSLVENTSDDPAAADLED
jgi:tetratricopeptide (TPR) repeat protein